MAGQTATDAPADDQSEQLTGNDRYSTISVIKDAALAEDDLDGFETLNERRKAAGQSWTEFINGQSPNVDVASDPEAVAKRLAAELDGAGGGGGGADAEEIADAVAAELADEAVAASVDVEAIAGKLEATIEQAIADADGTELDVDVESVLRRAMSDLTTDMKNAAKQGAMEAIQEARR